MTKIVVVSHMTTSFLQVFFEKIHGHFKKIAVKNERLFTSQIWKIFNLYYILKTVISKIPQ